MSKWIVTMLVLALAVGVANIFVTPPADASEDMAVQSDWMGGAKDAPAANATSLASTVFWPVAFLLILSVGAVVLYHKAAAAPVQIKRQAAPETPRAADSMRHAHVGR